MPRFVILEHDWPTQHWDLLLEAGGVLRAWRLSAEPAPGATVRAEPIADHRVFYLDYEGPVSDGRGSVSRWAVGAFDWMEDGPHRVRVRVRGDRLAGLVTLSESDGGWICEVAAGY